MRIRSLGTAVLVAVSAASVMCAGSRAGAVAVRTAPKLQPTEVNVTDDVTHRYGEPEVAVNPKNPKNMVYVIMTHDETSQCEASADPRCTKFFLGQPVGFWTTPGWYSSNAYVTFNGGKTWKQVDFPGIPKSRGFHLEAPDHSDLITRSDPMVTVTAKGTFYMGWDAQHLEGDPNDPNCCTYKDGGIAVSKSTDGGRTWSTPVLTGTGVDRPWMTTDLSTGRVYEASAGSVDGALSTGDASLSIFGTFIPDRYVVSTTDGQKWTTYQRLGGGAFSGGGGSTISAANGQLAAAFHATKAGACAYFVGTEMDQCTVFETSTDSGATWSRHAVPVPAEPEAAAGGEGEGEGDTIGNVMVAADPAHRGTFTVAVLNLAGTEFEAYVTRDNGKTWSGPATFTDNPNTTKFKAWINYSPDGTLGLAWRSRTEAGSSSTTPYLVFAATSDDAGKTWSAPLQISTAPSPGADPKFPDGGLDDTSVIALSNQGVFVGWGDWRPGEVQGYFSAVSQKAFKPAS